MFDTIVSPATALYPSAIGIVRISGSKTKDILTKITRKQNFSPRFAHLVRVYDEDGTQLDESIAIFYPEPSSYTGEDMAEIFLHGNPVIINHVVSLCIKNGARMAQEGEFTKRAFLNGKLSLEKAESVLSIVNSSTLAGVKASFKVLKGEFSRVIEDIRTGIIDVLSDIEASVDFPEDVDPDIPKEKIENNIRYNLEKVEKIYSSWKGAKVMLDGAVCVVIGKPNAGKSSLFNILVGESRAIISPFPGTTRDYIDARIDIGGVLIKLIDTAGVRETPDPIEKEGIKRAIELAKKSDIILCVFDSSSEFDQDDKKSVEVSFLSDAQLIIFVVNKSDKGDVLKYREILENIIQSSDVKHKEIEIVNTSCIEGKDINKVREIMKNFVMRGENTDFFALSSRQIGIILSVIENLRSSLEFISNSDYIGSVLKLREALTSLDDIIGQGSSQKVIDDIFKKFCIGK
ncbi:MAG: tRNA uridine-5-carboxymethylaminomethyl(34) synthesis GTPase MnmE [Candidatus Calescibacterium sp.]|nr:tRNA uridine-5-carboxymethylaminomethyl(34) synthesis GTPase MnmE [Candidatus Calescibacterium sp.]MCX7734141.1 tRNA uridine-5-carboxymethylaminomethyl(34) synthesis GTPase MnmE [bacterium]MDW8087866.1 tRNA uridine-5-carboxymethylaminomethyl(34) synthesis GTPase MnmE [Candidatus Calescibacterium sp.]